MAPNNKKATPGFKKKGGTMFPRINLEQAIGYAKKLAARTQVAPQPADIILQGVFGSSKSTGEIRASALKQFRLMEGTSKGYKASKLAVDICSSPANELQTLHQAACLAPKIFKKLFESFQNDSITFASIRQQAVNLGAHLDSADECVKIFIESLTYAGLAHQDKDNIVISSKPVAVVKPPQSMGESPEVEVETSGSGENTDPISLDPSRVSAIPGFQVKINLDSTMDPDKLERQLKLLKQFGVIK
jgi:hypothetical protein